MRCVSQYGGLVEWGGCMVSPVDTGGLVNPQIGRFCYIYPQVERGAYSSPEYGLLSLVGDPWWLIYASCGGDDSSYSLSLRGGDYRMKPPEALCLTLLTDMVGATISVSPGTFPSFFHSCGWVRYLTLLGRSLS